MEETKEVTKKESAHTKEQILQAKKYKDRKDVLNVLLANGKTYTLKEVDKLIESFMKKEVK